MPQRGKELGSRQAGVSQGWIPVSMAAILFLTNCASENHLLPGQGVTTAAFLITAAMAQADRPFGW